MDEAGSAARERQILQILAGQHTLSWADIGAREPFLSCSTVTRKVVMFDVTTNLCPGVTQSFQITFIPGFPARVCLLGLPLAEVEPQMTVQNGTPLPSLTLACFDTFNNRTDPLEVRV